MFPNKETKKEIEIVYEDLTSRSFAVNSLLSTDEDIKDIKVFLPFDFNSNRKKKINKLHAGIKKSLSRAYKNCRINCLSNIDDRER